MRAWVIDSVSRCNDTLLCNSSEYSTRLSFVLFPATTIIEHWDSICSCVFMETLEVNDNYLEKLPAKLGDMKRLKNLRQEACLDDTKVSLAQKSTISAPVLFRNPLARRGSLSRLSNQGFGCSRLDSRIARRLAIVSQHNISPTYTLGPSAFLVPWCWRYGHDRSELSQPACFLSLWTGPPCSRLVAATNSLRVLTFLLLRAKYVQQTPFASG